MWLFDINDKTQGHHRKALSFLSPEEVYEIGELKDKAIIGFTENHSLSSDNFTPNSLFVSFMHQVITVHAPSDVTIQNAASEQKEGWIYIIDNRALEHVLPEDIIGAFKVTKGMLVFNSYHPNENYAIFGERGLIQFPPFLIKLLIKELKTDLPRAE
jgi:hypothetical protein